MILVRFIIVVIFLTYSIQIATANQNAIDRVLKANSITDIYGTNRPGIEERKFYWSLSDRLINYIIKNPVDDDAWEAFHKFKRFADEIVISMYYNACYDAIKSDPLFYYDRYMLGDDQAIDRTMDAISGVDKDLKNSSTVVKSHIDLFNGIVKILNNKKSDDERHLNYLNRLEAAVIKYIEQTSHVVIQ